MKKVLFVGLAVLAVVILKRGRNALPTPQAFTKSPAKAFGSLIPSSTLAAARSGPAESRLVPARRIGDVTPLPGVTRG